MNKSLFMNPEADENSVQYDAIESHIFKIFEKDQLWSAHSFLLVNKAKFWFALEDFDLARECIKAAEVHEDHLEFQNSMFAYHELKVLLNIRIMTEHYEQILMEKIGRTTEITQNYQTFEEALFPESKTAEFEEEIEKSYKELKLYKDNSQKELTIHAFFPFIKAEKMRLEKAKNDLKTILSKGNETGFQIFLFSKEFLFSDITKIQML